MKKGRIGFSITFHQPGWTSVQNGNVKLFCYINKNFLIFLREDAHKKNIFLVVGPLRGGEGPPEPLEEKTFFSLKRNDRNLMNH